MSKLKASELRIGNYVLYAGIWQQVYSIGETAINIAQEPLKLCFIGGIPLTPEILLKAGFEKTVTPMHMADDYIDYRGNRMVLFILANGTVEVEFQPFKNDTIEKRGYITSCRYLHQLQNLYWCLCNKELTINL